MNSVPIKVYIKDKLDGKGWGLGVWEYTPEREVWGLTLDNYPTQMCYGMDYAEPYKAIAGRRDKNKKDPNPDWLRWYFDVGRKLYCTLDDLEVALKELGLDNANRNSTRKSESSQESNGAS